MSIRRNALGAFALVLCLGAPASAQTALAPWFDADGFYNRPGVELARATNDMTACRVEASRLKVVRNTRTRIESGGAFNASGAYDPVVAGAAYGIASIIFAIQDASYNGSIEQIEFRDCVVALGYRHYRLGKSDRERLNADASSAFAGAFAEPRYSTYVIPAGRYVLSAVGPLNACLSTITFDVADGDVAYLGDYVLRPQSLPMGSILNPVGNLNSGIDNRMRADLRVGIGDNIEAARAALQADEATRSRLARVAYQNGYRIPCDGRYIGRVANPVWTMFSEGQAAMVHDAMAAGVVEAAAAAPTP